MPTKTEYREYISSPEWQARRKEFLLAYPDCNRCKLPRWLAIVAYDQDLHVHHRSYAHIGAEPEEDLEPLCKRCHEIETFGHSALHEPKRYECVWCGHPTWRLPERSCEFCEALRRGGEPEQWMIADDRGTVAETTYKYLDRHVLPKILAQRRGG